MLVALYVEQPEYFQDLVFDLHKFLIACCWKHQHLIPQKALRDGLKGAERWIAGEISTKALNELEWGAEAEAFLLDYAKSPEDFSKIKAMIAQIPGLDNTPFDEAHKLLKSAAYFVDSSMIYPTLRIGTAQARPERIKNRPERWCNSLFRSRFVCADLLREHIQPDFPA